LSLEDVEVASTESIRELAEPVLTSAGLELWDVELARDVVRIMVDRPGGVDLEALTAASSALSPVLDAHPGALPDGRYQLEVSSPGIERVLRTPAQYRRYLGQEITVKTDTPLAGARRHQGLLVDAADTAGGGIVLEMGDGIEARLEIPYDQIDRARTVLVWGPDGGAAAKSRRGHGGRVPARQGAPTPPGPATPNPKDTGK
jgi:ribosome maturation factor RimP